MQIFAINYSNTKKVKFHIHGVIFLLSLTLICGCKKQDYPPMETKVHGHLVVRGTGEIINDRYYKVGIAPNSGAEANTLTDENGYFELSMQHEPLSDRRAYQVVFLDNVPDETFFHDSRGTMIIDSNDIGEDVESFREGHRGKVDLALTKRAWVELHVENITPQLGDQIRIRFLVWEQVFHHGQNFKVILLGLGNIPNRLDFWVSKPGVDPHLQTKWMQLGEMDTTYFKLEY